LYTVVFGTVIQAAEKAASRPHGKRSGKINVRLTLNVILGKYPS
jgi:hypothetical protein